MAKFQEFLDPRKGFSAAEAQRVSSDYFWLYVFERILHNVNRGENSVVITDRTKEQLEGLVELGYSLEETETGTGTVVRW